MNTVFVLFAVCVWALVGPREAAAAQTADAAFDRDVVKLMEATGAAKLGEQITVLATRQVIDRVRQLLPDAPPRANDIINEVVQAKFAAALNAPDGGLRARTIPIYEKYFTHDEIRALVAFYATDVGRKSVAVLPTIGQETAKAGLEWASGLVAGIEAELKMRFQAEGFVK
jgi:hypothetical protein